MSNRIDSCLGCRRRIMGPSHGDRRHDRAPSGRYQPSTQARSGLPQRRDQGLWSAAHAHAIPHPGRNRGRVLVLVAQPELATGAYAAPNENGLAVQRMPGWTVTCQCGGQNVTGLKTSLRCAPALRGLDPPRALPEPGNYRSDGLGIGFLTTPQRLRPRRRRRAR